MSTNANIAPGENWRDRLGRLIERAEAVVFIISPDSVRSQVCDWEINHAELVNKEDHTGRLPRN